MNQESSRLSFVPSMHLHVLAQYEQATFYDRLSQHDYMLLKNIDIIGWQHPYSKCVEERQTGYFDHAFAVLVVVAAARIVATTCMNR